MLSPPSSTIKMPANPIHPAMLREFIAASLLVDWELRATVRATTTPSTTSRRWSGRLWRSSIEDELRDLDCRPDRIERLAEGRGY